MSDWFADDKTVRVRKRQCCEACGFSIDPGDVSIYQRGRWRGDFFARHLHPVCWDIWQTTADDYDRELGDFWEGLLWWLIGHFGEAEGRECFSAAGLKSNR